ncbi:ABC-type dipeptide transport system, periplasmic component [Rivularia sp. PCC 7116]|uniref:ABC transporter substrate-binding protein n=1 Tax=Rivularia sp. PCC 7116 TaxID=373994 RepID=UPI00029EEE8D|nr:ABC transporter substrate-binding protein [Rivularia sp. PCC 7116]AFY56696.1 ABC-type dipeptide transport system, periplasmic component [Rivularia sp. PCC 7116]
MSLFSLSVRRWGRIRLVFSLLCMCVLLVSSCASSQVSNPSASASGNGRITIGTTAKPRTLDPADAYELSSLSLVYNMSDRLYTYEPGSTELKPELATALPNISDDGLTYTIPIRKGVVFHDDAKFDAKAMEFSLRRFIENKGKPSFLLSDSVDSVKATGDYELTIKLKQPFAAFTSLLAFSGVPAVSPQAYEIGEGKFEPNKFIGTGPYKLTKFGTDSLTFDVFEKYWGEKPANNGVNVQILSSGVNLYNGFRKKGVDIAYVSLDPDQITSLEKMSKEGKWLAIPNEGSVVSYLTLNRNQKPLDKVEVRQAIAAMIDRKLIYDRVLYGQAEEVYSMIPTTFDVYKPVFKQKYGEGNVEKAKELLKKAGFSEDNPAVVEVWYPSSSAPRSLTALVLKALAKKTMDGMLVFDVNTVESTSAFKNIGEGLYPSFLLDWYPDFLDADNYIQPFLSCETGSSEKGCEKGGSQSQGSFFYSERMNELIGKQREEQNPEKREQIFAQIQEILASEVPYVPLWQSKDYVFAQNGITGVGLDATQNLIYRNIKKEERGLNG